MAKPNKKKTNQPEEKPLTPEEKAYNAAAKRQHRYILACVGMLLYFMPGISCAALGLAMGAAKKWMIVGMVLMGLCAVLGFVGMILMSKRTGRVLMIVLSILLACGIAVPVPFLGGWSIIFLIDFVLLMVCLANTKSIDEVVKNIE
ncbi:MAG: hypothetical protein E7658_04730 [Ruminococcaceae bacterium]|nr:hypothetical protein [Oscillospiraceae bacterium]